MTNPFSLSSKLVAEFVGTFAFVATGVAAGLNAAEDGGGGLLTVALAHGFAVVVMVSAIGHVSGGHLNPAVTFAMLLFGKVTPVEAAGYVAVQLLAGAAAVAALLVGFDLDAGSMASQTPQVSALSTGPGGVAFLEMLFTFLFVWTVFAVAVDRDGAFFKVAGLPIGLAVTGAILSIGPVTGAALNPARWFGPALVSGTWDHAWVWIVGPLAGAALAAATYMLAIRPRVAA